jgi:cyclic beta-1,2-glucan synthetase
MYRLIVESLLGLRLEVDKLHVKPCIPANWKGFTIHYRYRETIYHIKVVQASGEGATRVTIDGAVQEDKWIALVDDHVDHNVEVVVVPIQLSPV